MLFIHIGTQKTGSSSIQHALAGNERILNTKSFHYVRAGRGRFRKRRIHHNPIAAAIKGKADAKILASLTRELKKANHAHLIISGELLSQIGIAQPLADLIPANLRDETKIIAYLRRPDLYVESLYKQRVKSGDINPSPGAFLERKLDGLMHESVLTEYAMAFGNQNVIIKPYDRKALLNGDGVDDFFSTIDFPWISEIERPARDANTSFSAAFSEISGIAVRKLSVDSPTITKAAQSADPKGIYRSKDVYPLEVRREILTHHEATIEKLRETYRPDLDRFFDDSDLYGTEADPFPSSDEQAQLMKAAVAAFIEILPHIPPQMGSVLNFVYPVRPIWLQILKRRSARRTF